jgi:ATP-dependent RNA helicase DHX29
MPAKKKKTQLKPVARGFATTSVPKKILPPTEPVDEPLETAPTVESALQGQKATSDASTSQEVVDSVASTTLDEGQRASQILVDKFQEKTEKEISR